MCYLRKVVYEGWEFYKLDWVVAPTLCALSLCDFNNKLLASVNGASLLLCCMSERVVMLCTLMGGGLLTLVTQ